MLCYRSKLEYLRKVVATQDECAHVWDNCDDRLGSRQKNIMRIAVLMCLICAAGLVWQPAATAKDKPGKGKGHGNEAAHHQRADESASVNHAKADVKDGFTAAERSAIQGYVRGYGKSKRLPPGLAKKVARGRGLPRGWQKKCVHGEIMPQAVYERCKPLPPELVVKLPPSPAGTVTVAIGGKAVRLVKATLEILDVFDVHVGL